MTLQEFHILCKCCDDLLSKGKYKVNRVAISWLHVLRGHPELLSEYTPIFRRKAAVNALQLFIEACKIIMHGFLYCCKSTSISTNHITVGKIHKRVDVFIFSHMLNETHAERLDDFYFGSIPNLVNSTECRPVILLLNHTSVPAKNLANKMPTDIQIPRIFLSKSTNPKVSINIYFSMVHQWTKLIGILKKKQSLIDWRIVARAATESLAAGTFANMRLYFQVKALVEKHHPRTIFFTFEGHAYERMIIAGAKSVDNTIKCIGYQHAAVFKYQHAMMRKLGSSYDPDVIWTTGLVPLSLLVQRSEYPETVIKVVGTSKAENIFKPKSESLFTYTCLVAPEAFLSECKLLFEYSYFCAKKYPKIKFIWRLHPLVDFKSFLKLFPQYSVLPKNIEWSFKNIESDIAESQAVLYRGSTVVISSVASGLYPIYLSLGSDEINIDPLYNLDFGKEVVTIETTPKFFDNPNNYILNNNISMVSSYASDYYCLLKKDAILDDLE